MALAGWLCPSLGGCICQRPVLREHPSHTPCLQVAGCAGNAFGKGWLPAELRTDTAGASAFRRRALQTHLSGLLPPSTEVAQNSPLNVSLFQVKQSCPGIFSSPKDVDTVVINNDVTVKPELTLYNLCQEI